MGLVAIYQNLLLVLTSLSLIVTKLLCIKGCNCPNSYHDSKKINAYFDIIAQIAIKWALPIAAEKVKLYHLAHHSRIGLAYEPGVD